jgi:hypothetical protein
VEGVAKRNILHLAVIAK